MLYIPVENPNKVKKKILKIKIFLWQDNRASIWPLLTL